MQVFVLSIVINIAEVKLHHSPIHNWVWPLMLLLLTALFHLFLLVYSLVVEDDNGEGITVRARPGRLSALGLLHSKSVLYSTLVWARRVLNSPKRRFPARAVHRRLPPRAAPGAQRVAFPSAASHGP